VALALLVLGTVGCNFHLRTLEYGESTGGRTPPAFAAACDEVDGTLAKSATEYGPRSTCTAANGDAISCDWRLGYCTTVCHSSERECATLRFLAYEPLARRHATPPATAAP
jgi:hypothetical protein